MPKNKPFVAVPNPWNEREIPDEFPLAGLTDKQVTDVRRTFSFVHDVLIDKLRDDGFIPDVIDEKDNVKYDSKKKSYVASSKALRISVESKNSKEEAARSLMAYKKVFAIAKEYIDNELASQNIDTCKDETSDEGKRRYELDEICGDMANEGVPKNAVDKLFWLSLEDKSIEKMLRFWKATDEVEQARAVMETIDGIFRQDYDIDSNGNTRH